MPTILALALLVVAAVWLSQRSLIYFPEHRVRPPHGLLPSADPVAFVTEDGLRLEGWFVHPTALPTGQTVIVFNGNGGNRGDRAPLAAALAARGLAVLLFDYRGYGGNPGLPSEPGLRRDARAALDAVLSREDIDPARVVYFGESLGSALAVGLAVERPPQALVLRSPFPSLTEVGRHHYPFLPVQWLLRDRYDTLSRVDDLRSPLLVVTGSEDRVIPCELSADVYDAAPEPKWLVTIEGADHNDEALSSSAELVAAIATFLAGVRQ